MSRFVQGADRRQQTLLPECLGGSDDLAAWAEGSQSIDQSLRPTEPTCGSAKNGPTNIRTDPHADSPGGKPDGTYSSYGWGPAELRRSFHSPTLPGQRSSAMVESGRGQTVG